jgi:hypothetical protein
MYSSSKRIFETPRLKSFAGYTERPVVQDTLSYFIPPFSVVSSRLVAFRSQLFEIWSPNSAQTPFYPGVCTGLHSSPVSLAAPVTEAHKKPQSR